MTKVSFLVQAIDQASGVFKEINKNISKSLSESKTNMNSFSKTLSDNREGIQNIGIASAAAFGGISFVINKAKNDAIVLQNSFKGLQSIVEGTGGDFNKAKKFIEEFTKDGLVSTSEAATSLKNLLSKGFGLQEASEMMYRFKDAAAFGRQASLSMGEAVQSATEGIKNENSILVDNAGITKNVSKMQEDYAKSIGKTYNELTEAEKRTAVYNGILEESKFQVGDAAKLTNGLAGQEAQLNTMKLQLSQTIGEILIPALSSLYEYIIPVVGGLKDWITKHPDLTKYIILSTVAITGITAALIGFGFIIPAVITSIQALGSALMFLTLNPIGALITAISGLIIMISLWVTHWDELSQTIGIIATLIKRDVVQKFTELKTDVLQIGSDIKWGFIGWIDSMVSAVNGKIEEMMNFVKKKVVQAKSMLSSITGTITTAIVNAPQNIGTVLGLDGTRASGGPVNRNGTYLVGEEGPELFTPSTSGMITPNNKLGNSDIKININFGNVNVQNQIDIDKIASTIEEKLTRTLQLYKLGIG